MARTTPPDSPAVEPPEGDAAELRRRLLKRAAIAGLLIAALLSVLALFDALNAPPPKVARAPAALEPTPTAPVAAEEAKPAEPPPAEQVAATEPKKAEEAPAQPEMTAAPAAPAAPPPKPERPPTKPAVARPATMKPSEPVAAKRAEPAAELARPPRVGAPASRPLTRAAEAARNFVLQLGVFNNTANAEELRAKLELNGIPSQIEARVQVGPFATRQEAEAAREKLKALGMEPGVLMTLKR